MTTARSEYIGTYTAFSGARHPLGAAPDARFRDVDRIVADDRRCGARNKGMALFPQKIGGAI